jgi:broad specificity phosphatase PhoE
MTLQSTWVKALAAGIGLLAMQATWAQDDGALLAALREGGHVGLMRHSTAPGSDDPPDFRLGDCTTQRNLSAQGRDQAAAIGRRLREHGIDSARVVSSQWCRCIDTAELLGLGPVEQLSDLNSLVSYPRDSADMTRDARAWILRLDLSSPVLIVTHQVNIGALVGRSPREGEIVVVKPTPDGELAVVGIVGVE